MAARAKATKGRKADGTLRKGYRITSGGRVVKASTKKRSKRGRGKR